MSWNYRLVKYPRKRGGGCGVHEVFYDAKGKPWGMTEEPVGFCGDTLAVAIKSLKTALRDVQKSPVLVPPKKWPGKAP